HLAVGDADVLEDGFDFFQKGLGFRCRGQVRFRDDFNQRNAGAVVIHVRIIPRFTVEKLSGVFFDVNPVNADFLFAFFRLDFHIAVPAQGQVVLGDLVALGQVRVEVIFPVLLGEGGNGTV